MKKCNIISLIIIALGIAALIGIFTYINSDGDYETEAATTATFAPTATSG